MFKRGIGQMLHWFRGDTPSISEFEVRLCRKEALGLQPYSESPALNKTGIGHDSC